MDKLDYVNNLLEREDLSNYIKEIDNSNIISPPAELKDKILNNCYRNICDISHNKIKYTNYNFSLLSIMKVACFSLIITLATDLLVNLSITSTHTREQNIIKKSITYKVSDTINSTAKNFSNFMLNYNLKGE